VANETAATISAFSISSATGTLTPVSGSPFSTGSSPESLAVDPAGSFVYAANVTSKNEIAAYAITPSTGALTFGTAVGAGTFPLSVVVDPLGQFVYAANDTTSDVSVYTVNATTGALTAVAGSPFLSGGGARSIAIY
jgi:6-phosphogluconolactonase (cycloisomerase 2 family)